MSKEYWIRRITERILGLMKYNFSDAYIEARVYGEFSHSFSITYVANLMSELIKV